MNRRATCPISTILSIALWIMGIVSVTQSRGQAVNLNFNNPVGSPDGSYTLGPYFSSSILDFTNVADVSGVPVDMRVTASIFGSGYTFQGHFANYNQLVQQPNGDLGNRYIASTFGQGGLTYTLQFYLGGSSFTTPYTLSDFDLLLYDVDGETGASATQTEAFRAYTAEGLSSYRLSNNPNSVTASAFSGGILFTGAGVNVAETDASGALLLNYRNTSQVTFQFESNTISGSLPNGVFTAIDGDKSLLGGDFSQFDPPVTVPEPSAAFLICLVMIAGGSRRAR